MTHAPPAIAVLAHAVPHAHAEPWWAVWNPDPLILGNAAALSTLYAVGLTRMWRSAGVGHGVSRLRAAAFAAGVAMLLIALVSPVDPLSDELSWVHMIQHMLLMTVAAPLFVAGAPGRVAAWALPERWRRRALGAMARSAAWRPAAYVLWQPLLLWALYAVVLWVWHLPALYGAALADELIHDAQHLSFFVAAALYWRVLLDPFGRYRLDRGVGVLYLFATSMHATVLGVFMTLSPRVWYGAYLGRTDAWGLTALEDQQLAGLTMWMPACAVYAALAAALFAAWLDGLSDPQPAPARSTEEPR